MRRFRLMRQVDDSGVSGTGHVADGCEFDNGKCVIVWRTFLSSVAIYDSAQNCIRVHGHGGHTKIEWIDE